MINSVKSITNLQVKSTNQNWHICTNNVETKKYKRNCIVSLFAYLSWTNCSIPNCFTVLKMVRFSEYFMWYGKEFQAFGPRYLKLFFPNYLIRLWNFYIQLIFFSCWMIWHSQSEDFLYETRINIIESFENFNTNIQTTIVWKSTIVRLCFFLTF